MDIGLILAASTADPTLVQTVGSYLWMILSVGAGLTFVIFVHELGHFLVAKACGVKCEKFYVGFDFFEVPIPFTRWKIPRSLVKFHWGETEYGLGSLPLGGYVKMLGQDDDPRNAEAEAARIRSVQEAKADGETPVPAQTTEGKPILLDPRSYPAKSVPARMAIISAGVIMNLIFAVILAAVAYRLGVEEAPAIVGGVTPGGPAWEKGIEPGSQIMQIGRRGSDYEHIRFSDIAPAAMINGTDRDLSILVRKPNGQKAWYELRPTDRLAKSERRAMLGIAPARSLEVGVSPEVVPHRAPKASPALQDRDKIVSIAGQSVANGEEVAAIFAQNPYGPITITVERKPDAGQESKQSTEAKSPRRLEIALEPKPLRELGLTMKAGPIVAIREDSPAAEAGFHIGDTILEINDEPVGGPMGLSQRLASREGGSGPLQITVERKDRQDNTVQRTLTVTPELPRQSPLEIATSEITSVESIGVAFVVTGEVADVTPGGPADKAGLKPGDRITLAEFPHGANRDAERKLARDAHFPVYEEIRLENNSGWVRVMNRLQWLLPENTVKLTWMRGTQTMSEELAPVESTTLFDESRGVDLYGRTVTHKAASMGEAFSLGARETVDQVTQVVVILHSLITNRISATSLSGPAGIIYAAGSFASQGVASLLMFLTILSANLAVLNFLPIPALDGGHMLFLVAEGIRGKPVDERLQIRLTIAGVICLLSLMVFATAMDIGRFAEMIQQWF